MRIPVLLAAAIAAFAVSAAPALAHEFVAKQSKGTVQDKNIGPHVFETSTGTIECKEESSKSIVQAKQSKVTKEAVLYGDCKAYGEIAEVSQAKYGFGAEGNMVLENNVIVTIPATCDVTLPSAENQQLNKVSYNNVQGGRMELKIAVIGLTSIGKGGICGATDHFGKYKGTSLVELVQGGTLEWR
jgi:hypothetical protein